MSTNVVTIANTSASAIKDHYVPGPIADDTPGNLGDYSTDPVAGRRIDYTGNGTNHSWGYNELVSYPPSEQQ